MRVVVVSSVSVAGRRGTTYTASYSTPTFSKNLVTSIYGLRTLDPVRNWFQNPSTHMISILQHFLFGSDGIHLRAETLPLRGFYIILSMETLQF